MIETRNARKEKVESEEAWLILEEAKEIIATKGKKVLRWSAPFQETKGDILDVVIGRSGTLRAPAIRVGDRFLIGFDEETMQELIVKS